jgi:hypothetical protein
MAQVPASTQQAISEDTGIPFAEIANMDWEEIERRIEQKSGRKVQHPRRNDPRRLPRGSVLLQLGRIIFPEYIERRLEKLK